MTRWETFEDWVFNHDRERFTSHELAESLGVSRREASVLIGSYLAAQRSPRASTLYVLKREGRTSAAVWSVGQRTSDAKIIGGMLWEDVNAKVLRAFRPDLERLADKNPRAARYCEQKIEAVMDGALKVLAAAVDTYLDESDDE